MKFNKKIARYCNQNIILTDRSTDLRGYSYAGYEQQTINISASYDHDLYSKVISNSYNTSMRFVSNL